MSITITDPTLLAQLAQAGGVVELKDPTGRVLGMFTLDGYGQLPPGVESPISDEEFERARKEPSSGVTLSEFWTRLRGGEQK